MQECILVVLTNPVAGREDEYNDWYTNRHLADVLKVPGFKAARRYKLAQDDAAAKCKYLAIYDFESEDPAKTLAALTACAGGPDMALSEAMNMNDPRKSSSPRRHGGHGGKSKACQWTLFHPMGEAPHACHALCFRRVRRVAVVQMRFSG